MIRQEILHSLSSYLIESGLSLAVWSVVYLILLRRISAFRGNRYFLLMGLLVSTLVPFFQFSFNPSGPVPAPESAPAVYTILLDAVVVSGKGAARAVENKLISSVYWVIIYLAGVSVFLLRMAMWMWQISKLIRSNRIIKNKENTFVLVKDLQTPYSFLWYIFVHPDFASMGKDYRTMVTHELEHVKQGHTYDVLMLELLSVFQWFNPFVWLLRRAVRENHEFLADRAVLEAGIPVVEYKTLLLHQTTGGTFMATSHFNRSLVKNRLRMMAQNKGPRLSFVRFMAAIALALTFSFVYAAEFASEDQVVVQNFLELPPRADSIGQEHKDIGESVIPVKVDSSNRLPGVGGVADQTPGLPPGQAINQSEIPAVRTNELTEQPDSQTANVFFIVEEMPGFPGGEDALRSYIAANIQYPDAARERGISGRVYISFVVSATGSVEAVKVARGVDTHLDEEALRVVSELPDWIPGRQRGVPVAVAYTVPINFTLEQ